MSNKHPEPDPFAKWLKTMWVKHKYSGWTKQIVAINRKVNEISFNHQVVWLEYLEENYEPCESPQIKN